MVLQPGPWLLFAAPNMLFPLMALFLWLDFFKYEAYVPLFIVGKFVCIFSTISWLLVSAIGSTTFWPGTRAFELVFLGSDLLAVVVFRFILKNTHAAAAPMPNAAEGE
ncbi:MAG: hypothetical protein FWG66_02040 [Spirochaetes bacterium]|nr:hypothetical protein [Spirochaetota bacterium]